MLLSLASALLELALTGSVAFLATSSAVPGKALEKLPAGITSAFSVADWDLRCFLFAVLGLVVVLVIIKNVTTTLLHRHITTFPGKVLPEYVVALKTAAAPQINIK